MKIKLTKEEMRALACMGALTLGRKDLAEALLRNEFEIKIRK